MPAPSSTRRDTRSWRAVPGSVPDARCHTRTVLAHWGLLAIIDDAEVIVSELLTNAHQALTDDASMISLRLLASQHQLLIMVWDGNPQMPVKKMAAPDDLDGRGLMIVEALSDACGAAPGLDGGKIVWARLLVSGQCS